jgi:drug/metabolite transporter (DMT)-like permease
MSPRPAPSPAVVGALWMLGAIVAFMMLTLSGRELSHHLNTFQIMLYRSALSLLMVTALIARGGRGESGFGQLRTAIPLWHLGRNTIHYAGQYSWFYGLAVLPIIQVTAIEFTSPIWTVLLASLVLGERLTVRRAVAVGLGFCGILVILRPGVIAIDPAAVVVLGAALCYATVFVLTKRMTATEKPLAILFYMFVVQTVLGFAPALPGFVVPPPVSWPWVVAVAASGLAAHYCLARAFMAAEASVVIPVDFLRLPLIGAVGWLLYGERPDAWLVGGAALILFGIWLNTRRGGPRN